jgi:hypothetical protein
MNETDFYEAGRLIQWSLQPDEHPINNHEYQKLLNRYLDCLQFRAMVKSIATVLGRGGFTRLGTGADSRIYFCHEAIRVSNFINC